MPYESTMYSAESLLLRYQHSGDLALRDKLVVMHLYIADIVARRFAGRGVDYDDLYQVASIALLKAIERFDLGKGVKFVSYATPTMIGEVKNYFRDKSRLISIPRRSSALRVKLREVRDRLEQELMRAPTAVEISEALDVPLEYVLEALESQNAVSPASLDAVPTGADDASLSDFLGISEQGYALFEARDQVARVLEQLSGDEREVIRMRFFDELSQRTVGEKMGVSQMTVSRVERRALTKLRAYLSDDEAEE